MYEALFFTDLRIISEALRAYGASGAGNKWRSKQALTLAAKIDGLADTHATYYDLIAVYSDILPTMEEALNEAALEDEASMWQQ